jgi:hypothetical protein
MDKKKVMAIRAKPIPNREGTNPISRKPMHTLKQRCCERKRRKPESNYYPLRSPKKKRTKTYLPQIMPLLGEN